MMKVSIMMKKVKMIMMIFMINVTMMRIDGYDDYDDDEKVGGYDDAERSYVNNGNKKIV